MFCIKCGEKLDEDSKFCIKCGAAVNTSSVPHTPPQAGSFRDITPEQMANQMAGQTTQPYTAMQANWQNQPQFTEPPKKVNKLIIVAYIIALAIVVGMWASFIIEYSSPYQRFGPDKEDTLLGLIFSVILLIPTILCILWQKKGNKKKILTVGIIYLISGLGIPSAILCFIAYAKMKKT